MVGVIISPGLII